MDISLLVEKEFASLEDVSSISGAGRTQFLRFFGDKDRFSLDVFYDGKPAKVEYRMLPRGGMEYPRVYQRMKLEYKC